MPRATRASRQKAETSQRSEEEVAEAQSKDHASSPRVRSTKGKEKEAEAEAAATQEGEGTAATDSISEDSHESQSIAGVKAEADEGSGSTPKAKMTLDERKQKMADLRKKMASSASANRKDLLLDKQSREPANRKDATNSRKLAKAEETLDERDAIERGEDYDRVRNWKYTIEDEEKWSEKLDAKEESRDKGIIDQNGLAARSYQRVLRNFKPDLKSYEQAAGASKASSNPSNSSQALTLRSQGGSDHQGQVVRREDVYAGVNNLNYGSHRPDDNAIDRVVSHLNMEADAKSKRSRKRPTGGDGEEDITYINDKNAHFNRKIGRFYDSYTKEIRDNFERGTAL